ncbi:hypothetical protein Peur_011747 [Populus x canadensis]
MCCSFGLLSGPGVMVRTLQAALFSFDSVLDSPSCCSVDLPADTGLALTTISVAFVALDLPFCCSFDSLSWPEMLSFHLFLNSEFIFSSDLMLESELL